MRTAISKAHQFNGPELRIQLRRVVAFQKHIPDFNNQGE